MQKSCILIWLLVLFNLMSFNVGCSENGAVSVAPTNSTTSQANNPSVLPQLGTPTTSFTAVSTINVQDAYKLIQNNKDNQNFVILDVRTNDEFKSGHINGAINIDYYSPDFKDKIIQLDRNKEYLVYCRTGIRAAASVQIMLDSGFTKVQNLSGGIVQWINAGYPTEK